MSSLAQKAFWFHLPAGWVRKTLAGFLLFSSSVSPFGVEAYAQTNLIIKLDEDVKLTDAQIQEVLKLAAQCGSRMRPRFIPLDVCPSVDTT